MFVFSGSGEFCIDKKRPFYSDFRIRRNIFYSSDRRVAHILCHFYLPKGNGF